jgi:hypothetical protein
MPQHPGSERHDDPGAGSIGSIWSIGSIGSILSIGSAGSVLSIGSAGSVLSIGSAGSVLSIGSAGSVLSIGSLGSMLSIGSRAYRGAIERSPRRPKFAPSVRRLGRIAPVTPRHRPSWWKRSA